MKTIINKLILLAIICLTLQIPVFAEDNSDDSNLTGITDVLKYGIESELVDLLKDIGTSPNPDIYNDLLRRYRDSNSVDTRIAFLGFFSNCKNLPQYVVDAVYADASSDILERRLESSLILCLGKTGKIREGLFLLSKIDKDDTYIQTMAADALSKMVVPELANDLLKRLEESDNDEEKYIEPQIKCRLLLFFGENKSTQAVSYLQKVVTDRGADRYMIMYAMVSLLKIGDVSSIKLIAGNLGNEDVKIKEYAAYALSLFKNAETLPYLRNMLLDNNEKIRTFGCQGISLNEDYESIPILIYKLKNDPESNVRNEALLTLVNLGAQGIDAVKDSYKKAKIPDGMLAYMCSSVTKKPDAAAVDYLVDLYKNGDKKYRDLIVKYSSNATSNLVDPLVRLFLDSTDYIHRINGIKIANQIESSALWDRIKEISDNDKVKLVRDNAKRFLDLRK